MYTIEELRSMHENQIFDRKSVRIDPKALAIPIVAFANADGGTIAIGISNDGQIEGINGREEKINELLRVPFDFCVPSVKVDIVYIPCIDDRGNNNRVLCIEVQQSLKVHANQADEVFYRVGDKSKKLSFEERMQLMYDKGDMLYEDSPVRNASIEDINMDFVAEYAKMINYKKTPLQLLEEGKKVIKKEKDNYIISAAAILLFGKDPQRYFPRARLRFIKYQGVDEKTGAQMNVIKDVMFEGTVLQMVKKAIEFVGTQIKEFTKLEKGGLFNTTPEYPEFVWNEIIINSVAHRDYSIKGTDIHIKMFEDRISVESPGTLPGLVRLNNMRNVHFSRKPKIAAFLKDYKYVKEFGEGIDRMYREMAELGLPEPEYSTVAFMTNVVVKNNIDAKNTGTEKDLEKDLARNCSLNHNQVKILNEISKNNKITQKELAAIVGINEKNIRNNIKELKDKNLLNRIGPDKGGHWEIINHNFVQQ